MRKYLVALSALIVAAFSGCQKRAGDPITKEFEMGGAYTELSISDAFNVTVSDSVDQIIITAGENVMSKVVVSNRNGKLRIYLKGLTVSTGELKATVPYSAELNDLELSGASEFHSAFPITSQKVDVDLSGASNCYCDIVADEIEMEISGSSDIYGSVTAQELDLNLSGASDAELEGQVVKLDIELSGSSSIVRKVVDRSYALACDQCEGSMSGSSHAYIHCDSNIKVNLSGSSDLHYTGNAATTGSITTGGSEIVHDVL